MSYFYKKNRKGFTLIELLVVISIIAILSTLMVANFNSSRVRARDAERKSDIRNIQTALRLYYNDKGFFPDANSVNAILGCGIGGVSVCTWGGSWTADSTTYMKILPADPVSTQTYFYTRPDPDTFILRLCLENKSDMDGEALTAGSNWACPSGWIYETGS